MAWRYRITLWVVALCVGLVPIFLMRRGYLLPHENPDLFERIWIFSFFGMMIIAGAGMWGIAQTFQDMKDARKLRVNLGENGIQEPPLIIRCLIALCIIPITLIVATAGAMAIVRFRGDIFDDDYFLGVLAKS